MSKRPHTGNVLPDAWPSCHSPRSLGRAKPIHQLAEQREVAKHGLISEEILATVEQSVNHVELALHVAFDLRRRLSACTLSPQLPPNHSKVPAVGAATEDAPAESQWHHGSPFRVDPLV